GDGGRAEKGRSAAEQPHGGEARLDGQEPRRAAEGAGEHRAQLRADGPNEVVVLGRVVGAERQEHEDRPGAGQDAEDLVPSTGRFELGGRYALMCAQVCSFAPRRIEEAEAIGQEIGPTPRRCARTARWDSAAAPPHSTTPRRG